MIKKIGMKGGKKMQPSIESLTTELIALPKRERLEIVRFLLFLDSRSVGNSNDVDSM
jgi:hypothetical protein